MIVTPLYAGLLGLWLVVLSMRIVGKRRSGKINLGDGGDADMLRRIRAQANFVEYVPLALLLLALLEIGGATSHLLLHVLGLMLLVGRVLHGISLGFTQHWFFGRFFGTILTYLVLVIAAVLCVWRGFMGLTLNVM